MVTSEMTMPKNLVTAANQDLNVTTQVERALTRLSLNIHTTKSVNSGVINMKVTLITLLGVD